MLYRGHAPPGTNSFARKLLVPKHFALGNAEVQGIASANEEWHPAQGLQGTIKLMTESFSTIEGQ